jgi:hypothetical protein
MGRIQILWPKQRKAQIWPRMLVRLVDKEMEKGNKKWETLLESGFLIVILVFE